MKPARAGTFLLSVVLIATLTAQQKQVMPRRESPRAATAARADTPAMSIVPGEVVATSIATTRPMASAA